MANLEKEIWKDIPSFEGKYQVSNMGRVRSLPRLAPVTNFKGSEYLMPKKGIILTPQKDACRLRSCTTC